MVEGGLHSACMKKGDILAFPLAGCWHLGSGPVLISCRRWVSQLLRLVGIEESGGSGRVCL